ncbi:MAG TPA: hypothetical protein VEH27_07150 [Methylomirabilota bacterium]|nr:hypothetical protein [Methylomirabilota bacterium]
MPLHTELFWVARRYDKDDAPYGARRTWCIRWLEIKRVSFIARARKWP